MEGGGEVREMEKAGASLRGGGLLPFRKLITLPHFPASKGCSFSRPMKVML